MLPLPRFHGPLPPGPCPPRPVLVQPPLLRRPIAAPVITCETQAHAGSRDFLGGMLLAFCRRLRLRAGVCATPVLQDSYMPPPPFLSRRLRAFDSELLHFRKPAALPAALWFEFTDSGCQAVGDSKLSLASPVIASPASQSGRNLAAAERINETDGDAGGICSRVPALPTRPLRLFAGLWICGNLLLHRIVAVNRKVAGRLLSSLPCSCCFPPHSRCAKRPAGGQRSVYHGHHCLILPESAPVVVFPPNSERFAMLARPARVVGA